MKIWEKISNTINEKINNSKLIYNKKYPKVVKKFTTKD